MKYEPHLRSSFGTGFSPLPGGEGWGEGVQIIRMATPSPTDRHYPLTLVPLPLGEGTGGNSEVIAGRGKAALPGARMR
jgi:hypothetical protein